MHSNQRVAQHRLDSPTYVNETTHIGIDKQLWLLSFLQVVLLLGPETYSIEYLLV